MPPCGWRLLVVRPPTSPEGVAGFPRNRWPASVGISGRIASESLAGLRRNHWPASVGISGRFASESAVDRRAADRLWGAGVAINAAISTAIIAGMCGVRIS